MNSRVFSPFQKNKMITAKKIVVWMDHAQAHLIQFPEGLTDSQTITSKFTHEVKEQSIKGSEKLMHNKETHEQSEYYKSIAGLIRGYDDILLFGPTEAKNELFNLLREDHLFSKVKIIVHTSDKMNDQQQKAFVKDYFQHTDIKQ